MQGTNYTQLGPIVPTSSSTIYTIEITFTHDWYKKKPYKQKMTNTTHYKKQLKHKDGKLC